MAWYRRSKLGFDAISSHFTSKLTSPKSTIRNSNQLSKLTCSAYYPLRVSKVSVDRSLNSRLYATSNRYYYVDSQQVRHFKPRGYRRWFDNPKNVFIAVLVGSGIGLTVYFVNVETIPYTKRRHLVLLSKNLERTIGESRFKNMKVGFKGKILHAMHPESVRVRLISKDIIEALQRGLKNEQGKNEVLDDMWVDQSRKKGKEKGGKSATGHLEGLNWEVLVVNDHVVNAFCLPGGKIVVFTRLLEHFRTDEEIATIIGHEVCFYSPFHIN